MNIGVCALCGEERELMKSHIIPAFAYRWLKKSSGNGHIRSTQNPNKRIQDGFKKRLLCNECENRFSRAETEFANKIFHPYTTASGGRLWYFEWMMYFCTSVSWRILIFYRDNGHLDDWDSDSIEKLNEAEVAWRQVLLGQAPHAGLHEQHLLPVDKIESATMTLPPNINRYLMRAIDMDLCTGNDAIFTFCKFGRFILVGMVCEPELKSWTGTKINANQGVVEPKEYILPTPFGEYILEKANRMRDALATMSPNQATKVEQAFKENADSYISSDAFDSMEADIGMFGENAFTDPKGDP